MHSFHLLYLNIQADLEWKDFKWNPWKKQISFAHLCSSLAMYGWPPWRSPGLCYAEHGNCWAPGWGLLMPAKPAEMNADPNTSSPCCWPYDCCLAFIPRACFIFIVLLSLVKLVRKESRPVFLTLCSPWTWDYCFLGSEQRKQRMEWR